MKKPDRSEAYECVIAQQASEIKDLHNQLDDLRSVLARNSPPKIAMNDLRFEETDDTVNIRTKDGYYIVGIDKSTRMLKRYTHISGSRVKLELDEEGRIALDNTEG